MDFLAWMFVLYGVFLTVIISAAVLRKNRRTQQLQQHAHNLKAQAISAGRKYSGTFEGVPYEYEYHAASRNSPSYLKIFLAVLQTSSQTPGIFKLTRENAFDRLCKKLGIALEIATGDPNFDKNVYITTNDVEFVRQYFKNPEKRRAALGLYRLSFNEVDFDGKALSARISPYSLQSSDDTLITQAVSHLKVLSSDIAYHPPAVTTGISIWQLKRSSVTAVSLLWLVLGVIVLVKSGGPEVLDAWQMFMHSLTFSLPAGIVWAAITAALIKGRSNSHYEWLGLSVFSVIGLGVLSFSLVTFINAHRDTARSQIHEARIIDKYTSRSKSITYYYVRVESWRPERTSETFAVAYSQYQLAVVNQSAMMVETKPGHLGFEWVVRRYVQAQKISSQHWPEKDYSQWNVLPANIAGMAAEEYAYWQRWCKIMEEAITNRMNVQEGLDAPRTWQEYEDILREYRRRQEIVLENLSALLPPERLRTFHETVISAGQDQLLVYSLYGQAKMSDANRKFMEFQSDPHFQATDKKLWDAYHNFQALYPGLDRATNSAIEQRLCWFDVK